MTKKERQTIFDKYKGRCAYCGCKLVKGWHADHIEPIVRDSKWNRDKGRFEQTGTCRKPENETLENYNPSCASCNIQKNSYSIEQFRANIKGFVNSLNQYSTQYKFAKRYGLVTETDIEVRFFFETVKSRLLSEAEYWKTRCKLSEAIEANNPCDPDITKKQIQSYKDYNAFIGAFGNKTT